MCAIMFISTTFLVPCSQNTWPNTTYIGIFRGKHKNIKPLLKFFSSYIRKQYKIDLHCFFSLVILSHLFLLLSVFFILGFKTFCGISITMTKLTWLGKKKRRSNKAKFELCFSSFIYVWNSFKILVFGRHGHNTRQKGSLKTLI
jgi:hypothetical protein